MLHFFIHRVRRKFLVQLKTKQKISKNTHIFPPWMLCYREWNSSITRWLLFLSMPSFYGSDGFQSIPEGSRRGASGYHSYAGSPIEASPVLGRKLPSELHNFGEAEIRVHFSVRSCAYKLPLNMVAIVKAYKYYSNVSLQSRTNWVSTNLKPNTNNPQIRGCQ